ncbi:hypothetical protein [Geomicrobium sp. JCM 19039]|uniref:hypothetical protein n=1 Tax=Geomicrobium sp. JCM 19039 TaxID=1460636 RepID=UPI0005A6D73D|nr:hypothetical protein [Geomicrobium sp. JCM 19039]
MFKYSMDYLSYALNWYTLMVMFITHSFIRKWLDKCTVMIERASGAFLILFGVRLTFMDSENK